jgi:AraC family transcriptional activator of pobA
MPERTQLIPSFQLYGEPPAEAELRFIHVETISARSRLHDWEIQPHRHAGLHQFLLVHEGGGSAKLDADEHRFAAPTFISIPPTIVHGFRFAEETRGFVLTVAEDFMGAVVSGSFEPELATMLTAPALLRLDEAAREAGALEAAFRAIDQEFRWPNLGRSSAIAAHITLILVTAARLGRIRLEAARMSPDALLVARLRHLIEEHYTEHWNVCGYAAALAVTESRLNTACRRVSGQSVLQLVHHRLLLEAKRNLIYTTMSVSQVGYALGFKDPGYFSRFFTRREGSSPLAFRERHGRERLGVHS